MKLYRLCTARGKLLKSVNGAKIQANFAFANTCVLVQSCLETGVLFSHLHKDVHMPSHAPLGLCWLGEAAPF